MTYREWCEHCKAVGSYRDRERMARNCPVCEGKGYVLRSHSDPPAGLLEAVAAYKRARDEAARLILAGQARHGQLADYEDDVLAPLRHAMYRAAGLGPI